MGDGLKRAFAATARTRWNGELTPEMRKFLNALPITGRIVPSGRLRVLCTNDQDKARQKCRKLGLALYGYGPDGAGWGITDHGRAALAAADPA